MALKDQRIKFAYYSDNDIQTKIDNGTIDAYDIIFGKESRCLYFVKPDLSLMEINSKVLVFSSENEANTYLNNSSDTYEGQIISILNNNSYKGYIVNKVNNVYVATAISSSGSDFDYNLLSNIPIVNLSTIGSERIIIGNQPNGIYSLIGNYKISNNDITSRSTANRILFIVRHVESTVYVKEITDYSITDYADNGNEFSVKEYVTDDTVESLVVNKMNTLKEVIKTEIEQYVDNLLDNVLDGKIATWVTNNFASDEEVKAIFDIE